MHRVPNSSMLISSTVGIRSAYAQFGQMASSQQCNLNTWISLVHISRLIMPALREIYDLTIRIRALHTAARRERESRQVLII